MLPDTDLMDAWVAALIRLGSILGTDADISIDENRVVWLDAILDWDRHEGLRVILLLNSKNVLTDRQEQVRMYCLREDIDMELKAYSL